MVKKGERVLVEKVLLRPEERAPQVPDDTKRTPLKAWMRGSLNEDAEIGDEVRITTETGRTEDGILLEVNPQYKLNYGNYIPELLKINRDVREILFGGDDNDK